jgi:hypothetical protein
MKMPLSVMFLGQNDNLKSLAAQMCEYIFPENMGRREPLFGYERIGKCYESLSHYYC